MSKEGWSDITELLSSAAAEMSLGEMVHGESFSLFEAMSALELMDPKMDSGMQSARVVPVIERVRSGALCFQPWPRQCLNAARTICVMDRALALETLVAITDSMVQWASEGKEGARGGFENMNSRPSSPYK